MSSADLVNGIVARTTEFLKIHEEAKHGLNNITKITQVIWNTLDSNLDTDVNIKIIEKVNILEVLMLRIAELMKKAGIYGSHNDFDENKWMFGVEKKTNVPRAISGVKAIDSFSGSPRRSFDPDTSEEKKSNTTSTICDVKAGTSRCSTPRSSCNPDRSIVRYNPKLNQENTGDELKILPPQKVYEPDMSFSCVISYVENPSSFYVIPEEILHMHSEITTSINRYYKNNTSVIPFKNKKELLKKSNEYFACEENADDENWGRCSLSNSMMQSDDEVEVLCIDVGERLILKASSIYPLAKKFYNYPILAYQCSMDGLEPFEDSKWSEESINFLKEYLFLENQAFVSKIDNNILHVFIAYKNAPLNNALVKKKFASVSEEADNINNFNVQKETNANMEENCSNDIENAGLDEASSKKTTSNNQKDAFGETFTADFKIALEGNDFNDEKEICQFYQGPPAISCFKKDCRKLHVSLPKDGWTVMKQPVSVIPEAKMPTVGSSLTVAVGTILTFRSFYGYVLFSEHAYVPVANTPNNNIVTITKIMNDPKNAAKLKTLTHLPAYGQYLAAKYEDGLWYRAMVISFTGEKANVLFVDYGNCQMVDMTDLREMDPAFCMIPKQSILFKLANVQPVAQGGKGQMAKNRFTQLVTQRNLVATVMRVDTVKKEVEVLLYDEIGQDIGLLMGSQQLVMNKGANSGPEDQNKIYSLKYIPG